MMPAPSPSEAIVCWRALRVRRGPRLLLDLPALRVQAGEFVAVLGPNGAGKSTLLKAITAEWRADDEIRLFGRPVHDWHRGALAKRLAVMPQQSTLSFDFSVSEVVGLGRLPHRGEGARAAAEAVRAAMSMLGLDAFANRRFTTLSGGERQRVQFARVLAQLHGVAGDRLLLLDEPTSALDLAQQKSVLDRAWQCARERTTVIAVMHDLNMAARYADRVLILKSGRLFADRPPRACLHAETVESVFGLQATIETASSDGKPMILIGPDGRLAAADCTAGRQSTFG
jgi:iron complex transport system ATP-binding protein